MYECTKCGKKLNANLVFRNRQTGKLQHGVGYSPSRSHPFAANCGPVEKKKD